MRIINEKVDGCRRAERLYLGTNEIMAPVGDLLEDGEKAKHPDQNSTFTPMSVYLKPEYKKIA